MKDNIIEMETRSYPLSYNENNNSVQVVFSTGERVLRNTTRAQYWEDLEISNSAIDFTRLNSGAPVLKNHDQSFDSVIGVVERGYIENGEAIASIKFSSREDVKPIIQDIKDGVLRNISVGYRIEKLEKVEEKNSNIPVMRAVRWVPFELSICPMGADSKAQIRNLDSNITQEEEEMILEDVTGNLEGVDSETKETIVVDFNTTKTEATDTTPEAPAERSMNTVLHERKRINDILTLTRQANLSTNIADELIGNGSTVEQARSQILDKIIANQPQIKNTTTVVDNKDKFRNGVEQSLLARSGLDKYDSQNEFNGMSLMDFAKESVKRSGGVVHGNVVELVGRAFNSTSDFPYILGNIANKSLKKGYEEQGVTWDKWCKTMSVPDFKTATVVSMSEIGSLLDLIPEGGEYKAANFSEDKETVSIQTFGKMIHLSRQMIINDDLNALSRIPQGMGALAKRTLNNSVYTKLFANPTMNDTKAIFHTDHGNLLTGALNVANLDAARVAMSRQKDLSGTSFLNIAPDILLVPNAIQGTAKILMGAQWNPDSTKFQVPNIVGGMCQIYSDALLDANSTTAYYLISSQYESFVVAFLNGVQEPYTETQIGFDTDGLAVKVRLDWGICALDFRPVLKSTGAS
jgi:phage head maturation protease